MALIGKATIGSPLFEDTLEAVPDVVLRVEDIRSLPEKRLRFLVWVDADDFDAFEDALSSDPTVGEYTELTDVGDRRLYRFTLSELGEELSTYVDAATSDIAILDQRVTSDGMSVVARLPSRESLREYTEVCDRMDVPFHLERLYEEETVTKQASGRRFGLTDPQHRALCRALEMGYFDVPRKTSLDEIADELGVSGQALSTLLRRGQRNLLNNTLG